MTCSWPGATTTSAGSNVNTARSSGSTANAVAVTALLPTLLTTMPNVAFLPPVIMIGSTATEVEVTGWTASSTSLRPKLPGSSSEATLTVSVLLDAG